MSQTDPTPDLAVLGRLEEIEREHQPQGNYPWCRILQENWPCLTIQLARAARVQQERIELLERVRETAYEYWRKRVPAVDLPDDWKALRDALAAAAPSREGE